MRQLRHRLPWPLVVAGMVSFIVAGPGGVCATDAGATPTQPAGPPARAPRSRKAWESFVDRERREELRARDLARAALRSDQPIGIPGVHPPKPKAGLDVIHRAMDVDVDPGSGAVNAIIDYRLTTIGRSLSTLGFSVAPGLAITSVEEGGRAATVETMVSSGFTYTVASFARALPVGRESTVRIRYEGTAACQDPEGACSRAPGFARYTTGSVFPYIFDLENSGNGFDGATSELTLRVPQGMDAVASGDREGDRIEGGKSVTLWRVPREVNHAYGFYAFVGDFSRKPVTGRPVPTELVSPKDGSPADAKLSAWSNEALAFVETQMGAPLPFKRQTLVRLPKSLSDVGTVSYGMTLLNESYGRSGDPIFRETWVHENSHLAWAIVVPEPEALRTRILTEGLATLTEIEFSKSLFPTEDRDEYLARRFHAIRLDWRGHGTLEKLPPVVSTETTVAKLSAARTRDYSGWAYEKSSATLDHIRATIGDEAFTRALHEYVKVYAFKGASVDEFQKLLESASGMNLTPLFKRWVTATARPNVRVGFRRKDAGKYEVTIEKDDEDELPLSLFVTDLGGERKPLRVTATGTSTTVDVPSSIGLYSVRPNPRLGILTHLSSGLAGDVNFDGEADGKDLLACARSIGVRYAEDDIPGLWDLESRFPVECDRDDDGDVDENDWEAIETAFGGSK